MKVTKSLLKFAVSILPICIANLFATDISSGYVSGIWNQSGSPYNILGSIIIDKDDQLLIEPGVEVVFNGHYNITVRGSMKAVGTINDSISFVPDEIETGWGGIKFFDDEGTDSSKVCYSSLSGVKANGSKYMTTAAIHVDNYNDLLVSNNTISDNNSPGIYSYKARFEIKNNSFLRNQNGAICAELRSPHIIGNTIRKNNSANGAALYFYNKAEAYVINNLITDNYCSGIKKEDGLSSVEIHNNTITNNSSEYGGGIYLGDIKNCPTLTDNIITSNTASVSGNQIYITNTESWIGFDCNNIEGGIEAFGGNLEDVNFYTSNIDQDPGFSTSGEHPYGLSANSPCIDQGSTNTQYLPIPDVDILGKQRISHYRIDMGCYEFQDSTDTSSMCTDFYPLTIGNYWEYQREYRTEDGDESISSYSVEVVRDTLFENGNVCKILKNIEFDKCTKQPSHSTNSESYHFERVDSTTSNVYRCYASSETLIDSLKSYVYDETNANRFGYFPNYGGTICRMIYDYAILGEELLSKEFSRIMIPNNGSSDYYLLTKGLGLTIHQEWGSMGSYLERDSLIYAKIDGKEYGSPSGIIEKNDNLVDHVQLCQNYPNPFNPSTSIKYKLAAREQVNIRVFNASGEQVWEMGACNKEAGEYSVQFDGSTLNSGVYFYSVELNNTKKVSRKMILLK